MGLVELPTLAGTRVCVCVCVVVVFVDIFGYREVPVEPVNVYILY